MTSKEQCCDDRFEIINETKQYIINATNIETSPEEMDVLDSICFRLWQLGLTKRNKDKLYKLNDKATPKKPIINHICNEIEGDIDYGLCPICERPLGYAFNYCEDCGQALDWSDEDDK